MSDFELLATASSIFMSTTLAIVALLFSYRQNVGWPPVFLISSGHLQGVGGLKDFSIVLKIEAWNRRKYPVSFRSLYFNFSGIEIDKVRFSSGNTLNVKSQKYAFERFEQIIPPNAGHEIAVEFVCHAQPFDIIQPYFDLKIYLFDPHLNKEREIKLNHKFGYPHFGWEKTEGQRAEIKRLFESEA